MKIRPIELLVNLAIKISRIFNKRDSVLNKQAVNRIVVFSMTAIGDTFISTPAIRSIRMSYPKSKIILILHPNCLDLFKLIPDADVLLTYKGGWKDFISILRKIRRYQPDLAIVLHGNEPQAAPLAYLSGAKWRFKLPLLHKNSYLWTIPVSDQLKFPMKDFNSLHAIEQRLQTVKLAGCEKIENKRFYSPLTEDMKQRMAKALFTWSGESQEERIWVGFQVGASKPHRTWPIENFIALAGRLLENDSRVGIVLTGSPQERGKCEEIVKVFKNKEGKIINSAGLVPLADLPGILANLKCLVTGDTGTMHMSIAVGTPTIALFGAANSKITGAYQDMDKHIVIQRWKTCSPCLWDKCPYTPAKCMLNFDQDEVFSSVLKKIS